MVHILNAWDCLYDVIIHRQVLKKEKGRLRKEHARWKCEYIVERTEGSQSAECSQQRRQPGCVASRELFVIFKQKQ
jgi:hypothetical protein